jgi:hypothetical protein
MPNFKSIRNNSNKTYNKENIEFNLWLAGIIDGEGCFQLSKKRIS